MPRTTAIVHGAESSRTKAPLNQKELKSLVEMLGAADEDSGSSFV